VLEMVTDLVGYERMETADEWKLAVESEALKMVADFVGCERKEIGKWHARYVGKSSH